MANLKIALTCCDFGNEIVKFCESLTKDWQEIAKNPERKGTWDYFAWRYIAFEIDQHQSLEIYDMQPRSRGDHFLWEFLAEGMIGFIVILDSSNPITFREAKNTLERWRAYAPTPCVIAANKQDVEGAWSAEDLRIVLRIPPEIPIIPCVASDKKSVANVLIALCEEVLRDIDADEAGA